MRYNRSDTTCSNLSRGTACYLAILTASDLAIGGDVVVLCQKEAVYSDLIYKILGSPPMLTQNIHLTFEIHLFYDRAFLFRIHVIHPHGIHQLGVPKCPGCLTNHIETMYVLFP